MLRLISAIGMLIGVAVLSTWVFDAPSVSAEMFAQRPLEMPRPGGIADPNPGGGAGGGAQFGG